jgi:TonB family protein
MILPLLAMIPAAPPPTLSLPAPIVTVPGELAPSVLSFRAGPARCEGGEERLAREEPPLPVIAGLGPATGSLAPVALRFRIDSTGRPLSIVEEPRQNRAGPYFNGRDVIAAFAASQFRPGGERSGCTIAYQVAAQPIGEADPEILYRFVALQPAPSFDARRAVFERIVPAGSNCFGDRNLNVRLRAYPAFEEIAQPPGTLSFSFVGFDLDSSGRPQNVRLLGSGGNSELDRQSLDAVRRSRFSPIAKRGCTYSYWRRQTEPLRPPEPPRADAGRPDSAPCPDEATGWAYMPPLGFPAEFERRAIEGWAVLKFDVAPWGGVGNVSVVAAEPAAPFGQQAAQIVSASRKAPSARGYTGCVARVLFRLPNPGDTGPMLEP